MSRVTSFGLLLLLVSLCVDAAADQPDVDERAALESTWPFIRGPNFDGHSEDVGLAEGWPAAGPPVLWTRELGQGYSSFVAWNDRVVTQYQTLTGQYVICLDADSGDTIWRHRYGWPYEPAGVYPGPRATPTYADGRVYFAGPYGVVGCLNAEDGQQLWAINLTEQFAGKGTGFGYSCSPTVVDDKVLLPVGGRGASLVALDARSGAVVWKEGNDSASYTPAYPIVFQGRRLVLGYLQNVLVCHDLETGEQVWRHELSSGYDEHSAWPIYREPHLWISSAFQAGSELLELTGDSTQPARTVVKSRLMSNDIFSSVLVGDCIYGFDLREAQAKTHRPSRGRFRCIDFMTGEERWAVGDDRPRRRLKGTDDDAGNRVGHATVIVADGKLILMNDTGELILARVNSDRYEELCRTSVLGGAICWTQPALHRGRLFVRNQTRAACVYLGLPATLQSHRRSSALTTADIPQAAYVDVAAMVLGVEPEYAFDLPSRRWLVEWYLFSLIAVFGVSFVASILIGRMVGAARGRVAFWFSAFLLGAVGTTLFSRWRNDFVFTWPVCIFVTFQAVCLQLRLGRPRATSGFACRPRLVGLLFLGTCVAYFLLCRRLSLVFEWVFLCGFAAALPFSLGAALLSRTRRWPVVWETILTTAAFSAFYWSAVGVLMWKAL